MKLMQEARASSRTATGSATERSSGSRTGIRTTRPGSSRRRRREGRCSPRASSGSRISTAKLYAQDRWSLLLDLPGDGRRGQGQHDQARLLGAEPRRAARSRPSRSPRRRSSTTTSSGASRRQLPERGTIGIFNRSHYEETSSSACTPRSSRARADCRPSSSDKDIWEERFEDIRAFEKHLARNGTVVLKFFLNVSREEQRKRFLARIDEPDEELEVLRGDVKERERWDDYMRAYEEAIRATATKYAPWYVVPADHKWFTRLVVAAAVADALEELDVGYPKLDAAQRRGLAAARRELLNAEVTGFFRLLTADASVITAKTAPCGSCRTAKRPMFGMSVGGTMRLAAE